MKTPHLYILSCAVALAVSCATGPTARLIEVDRTSHIRHVGGGAKNEEFYVSWTGANITQVKFEYRQINLPNEVFAKAYVPICRRWNVFSVSDAEFTKGGRVTGWRATLWRGSEIVSEKKSALW